MNEIEVIDFISNEDEHSYPDSITPVSVSDAVYPMLEKKVNEGRSSLPPDK